MEVKVSDAQGHRREAGSEGSVKQRCEPMNKNRIQGEAPDERATYREVHIHQRRKA